MGDDSGVKLDLRNLFNHNLNTKLIKIFVFKQKTAYEVCGRDWSSDVLFRSDLKTLTTFCMETYKVYHSMCVELE